MIMMITVITMMMMMNFFLETVCAVLFHMAITSFTDNPRVMEAVALDFCLCET